jgi:hypothetical protein
MDRRRLLGTGMLGGVAGVLAQADKARASAEGQRSEPDNSDLVRAVDRLRLELQTQQQFTEIAPIRDVQVAFLRTNGKLPDFLEVGVDRWFGVYDWHVRWQQPLALGRDGLGRYTIQVIQTQVILRVDAAPAFIGVAYDTR